MTNDCVENHTTLAYLSHLLQASQTRNVILSQDVFTLDGRQLAAQGEKFDHTLCGLMQDAELSRPVVELVAIESVFDAASLLGAFDIWIQKDPGLKELAQRFPHDKLLQNYCESLCQFAQIRQYLTLLAIQLPEVFEQALFCAWMGVLIVESESRDTNDACDMFFAGLCHDLGKLWLPPDLVCSSKPYRADERKTMQGHCELGREMLNAIKRFPTRVSRAVWEHHENLDGTGYPLGRLSAMISRHGQMLNALDCLQAIYVKRYKPASRTLFDLVAVLRMNGHGRFGAQGKRLIAVLSELPENSARCVPDEQMPGFIDTVRDRHSYITSCVDSVNLLATEIGFRHNDPRLFALQNTIIHISVAISQSGLINDAYVRWLKQVESELLVHAYREVEDAFLLMLEILYHLEKLKQKIRAILHEGVADEFVSQLEKGIESLDTIQYSQTEGELESLWLLKAI